MTNKKKSAGDGIKVSNAGWVFNKKVSKNFEKHVSKSVPFYNEGHDIVCELSDFFLNKNSNCYDLGCSTGTLLKKLSKKSFEKKNIKFFGIDLEAPMAKKAKEKKIKNCTIYVDDLLKHRIKKSDLIIAYYTIQFINPRSRQQLINKIYKSLNWGGAFLFFEKVRAPDARFQDIISLMYNEFKLKNLYTPEDIISKSRSLKGVLEPFSSRGNLDLMKRAGFKDIVTVMKHLCFEGFLAIK
jgi:tRNA (cmo5U34)-methyltransferase